MKLITLFLPLHIVFVCNSQITDTSKVVSNVTTYNFIYKGYRASGMTISDSINNPEKEFFSCCYDDTTIMFYNYKSYYENGQLKLDSTIDMMSKRKAKLTVTHYNKSGKVIYLKKLTSKLDKNRTEIPKRKDVLWNGKIVKLNNGNKNKEHIADLIQ